MIIDRPMADDWNNGLMTWSALNVVEMDVYLPPRPDKWNRSFAILSIGVMWLQMRMRMRIQLQKRIQMQNQIASMQLIMMEINYRYIL